MSSSDSTPAARRRLPRWARITIIVLLAAGNLAALGAIWLVNTGHRVLAAANTDEEVVEALTDPTGEALTFLVVGSDSREGLDDLSNFGSFSGQRGDVVMLVRLDPSSGGVTILSIPRDLWVEIPGRGAGRINAAYAYGGSKLMVETIGQNLGIEVNHYLEIGFVGFEAVVDELGGIELTFAHPARDRSSGLDVEAGTQTVDGETALAYARSRKYQELRDGSWVNVDASDIGRTGRQQDVIRAIVTKLKRPSSLTEAGDVASALARHVTVDANFAASSVGRLFWDFRGLIAGDIEGMTLPVDPANKGGASVVVARQPDADQMIAAFISGDDSSSAPLQIRVLNGNGVDGAADRMSKTLEGLGMQVESIGNADTTGYEVTTVIVPPGSDAGDRIVTELGFGVVEFGSVDNGYDAVVIVGADAP